MVFIYLRNFNVQKWREKSKSSARSTKKIIFITSEKPIKSYLKEYSLKKTFDPNPKSKIQLKCTRIKFLISQGQILMRSCQDSYKFLKKSFVLKKSYMIILTIQFLF